MATSTTFAPSGITVQLRESLDDIITNIAPADTIFLSGIGKRKINGRYIEWLEDTLAAAANNAVTEGMDATYATIVAPSRVGNYVQQSTKWFKISDILEAVDKAGKKSEVAYQTTLKLKELSRDMEYALLNNTTSSATDPRSLKGFKGFVTTSGYTFTTGTASTTLTEALFNTAIQLAWSQGGNVNMVLAPGSMKKKISAFNGQSRLTITESGDKKGIIAAVDLYECDFGVVKIYASRFMATDDSAAYDSVFFVEKEKWALGSLLPVKVEKLAKTGLGDGIQISTAYTLICRSEKANSRLKNCNNA